MTHIWASQAELDDHRDRLREALHQVRTGEVSCGGCGRSFPLRWLFRCYHCGLWFCDRCSAKHFGPRPPAVVNNQAV